MRWYFVDRIDSYMEWKSLTARKAVSFEEVHLLEKQGRQGEFPETLLLETCVESLRWLIVRSSEFQWLAILHAIDAFSMYMPACCGDVLSTTVTIDELARDIIVASCTVFCARGNLAEGKISVKTLPLDVCGDRSLLQGAWKDLHGKA
jgi:3-hydroxymyristoyl/3-hydroxydecanoyl-(acyl carrier protein) dehydratase